MTASCKEKQCIAVVSSYRFCCGLYLEYAEEQGRAEGNHEELRQDDGQVGDLHPCKQT